MMFFNPMRSLIVPFLLVATAPLALFAGLTTILAFSILIIQVIFVYVELFASLLLVYITELLSSRQHLEGTKVASPPGSASSPPASASSSPTSSSSSSSSSVSLSPEGRSRRRSSGSIKSVTGSITPVSEAGLGLIPSVGPVRDFEGVGGWRVGDAGDDAWAAINSRLEMPDRQRHGQHSGKGHHRSLSGGPTTPGADGGILMMKGRTRSPGENRHSPNSSRARTPTGVPAALTPLDEEGYFPALSPKSGKKAAVV